MVKVAFAKAVINDLWPAQPGWGYHDDVEARCVYFSSSDQSLLFIALDIGILSRRRDGILREEVARRLNMSIEEILVHCIQAHNAVPYTQVYLDKVAERVAEVMRPAMAKAQEAEIAFACADVNRQFSVNRRKYVNDDLGVCTFWDGYRKEGTRADAAHLVAALRKSLLSSRPSNIYWPGPQTLPVSGSLAHLLVFRTLNGKPLGSLLRFSTHVQTAVVPLERDKLYTADFPHYTRKRLEEALGGIAIFASGPAGNIVPLQEEWTWKETERYGNALADAALAEYSKNAKFKPLTRLKVRSPMVDLPVRVDMPTSVEEARRRAGLIREELNNAAALGAPLRQIKRMTDLLNHYEWSPNKLVSWNYLDPEEAHERRVTIRLTGVALNDILILGMPGEAVCETSLWLRANSVGIKLLTLYDCNGDIGYMPEAQDYPHGGYEAACSIIAPDGETYLRGGALMLIREICR